MRIKNTSLICCLLLGNPFTLFWSTPVFSQVGQINIDRVQQMPNVPSPYVMRNWKETALQYDDFVFSTTAIGQYLPLISLMPSGVNYPAIQPIFLNTYVGSIDNGSQAEAINIIPSIVGATLMGIDKSNQTGINWALKAKDFFNRTNGQNIYLNSYSTASGHDWWYDVMPNVYFYQLYSQYPALPDFKEQFTTVADRWLEAVHTMGGSTTPWAPAQMNHRGWYLSNMTPNDDGVKEPESAGTIAWLLYQAYSQTGEKKYLHGAQMAMEFLSNLNSNPSYELQLPYGTFMAARMNAELGTQYDIEKMIGWSFDKGPLRNWGTIVGRWGESDVSGLIGEANDAGNDYAFVMNGFQQAAALVPLIKYDKRFARAIAKWVLNLANASRLFYSAYLPSTSQDNFGWSSVYDLQSVIAYESLKENLDGKKLYATGDAMNGDWAQTNLSIYSSSSVGYLAAVVEPSDVEGILVLDLNKTDFLGQQTYPAYVIYNPHAIDKMITLMLPPGSHDIYDAISETMVKTNVNESTVVTIKADEAVLLVYVPTGITLRSTNGKLYADAGIIDHHYNYDYTGSLRIKSLSVVDTLVEIGQEVSIYTAIENAASSVVYSWLENGQVISTTGSNPYPWKVPVIEGRVALQLTIESGGKKVTDSIVFNVVDNIPAPPIIQSLLNNQTWYTTGSQATVTCEATDQDGLPGELKYQWMVSAGTILQQGSAALSWQLPADDGIYTATCMVTDLDGMTATEGKSILVKPPAEGPTAAFAFYPLDGDVLDYSGNHRDAKMIGVDAVPDARGVPFKAYLFDAGSDVIFLDNSTELNFQNQITVSFWVKLTDLIEESFIISHGSWEERWKVSVTPGGWLRWSVKTANGIKDLDSTFPLALNQYYHFAAVYSGYSMELYADGELDNFLSHSGLMSTTNKSMTLGRKDESITRYSLNGVLDEVRIYNASLVPDEIRELMTIWNHVTDIKQSEDIVIYPIPAKDDFYITGIKVEAIKKMGICDLQGKSVEFSMQDSNGHIQVSVNNGVNGLLILEIQTAQGIYHWKVVMN